jgi:hypothetical protein
MARVPEDTRRDEEIAAIFEALRAVVRAGPASVSSAEVESPVQLPARRELDRLWRVTAERPFLRRPGPFGFVYGVLVLPVKWVLRRLMRWYVEPMAADQRAFNAAVMRALDEQLEWMQAELKRLERSPHDSASQSTSR